MFDLTLVVGVLAGVLLCLRNAYVGFYVTLAVGLLQDPLRKMVPGEPVYLTVLVGVFAGATYVGMVLRGTPFGFHPIHDWNPAFRTPLRLFVLWVVVQSGFTLLFTGSAVLAGIGLLAYLAPLLTVLLGYHLTRTERDLQGLLRFYVLLSVALVSGVYLSYLGITWPVLRAVGVGLYAYAPGGGVLDLLPGFFRGSELAGWHAAAAACLLLLLTASRRQAGGTLPVVVAGGMIILLAGAILLTGRRKFLIEILLFVVGYRALTHWQRVPSRRFVSALLAAVTLGVCVYLFVLPDELLRGISPYLSRTLQVQEQAPDRVSNLTWNAFRWIILRNGVLGAGAGTGSQGAQYFGGGAVLVGSAAEGGLGKVLAELGVPGLLLLGWLAFSIMRYILAILRYARGTDPVLVRIACGLTAFLAANGVVFTIAHQIFGDLFVLLLLGWLAGALMAIPRLGHVRNLQPLPQGLGVPYPLARSGGSARRLPSLSGREAV